MAFVFSMSNAMMPRIGDSFFTVLFFPHYTPATFFSKGQNKEKSTIDWFPKNPTRSIAKCKEVKESQLYFYLILLYFFG